MKTLRSFKTLNEFCAAKKTLFGFLEMVYDGVGDEDKVSNEILVLEGFIFVLPVT